MSKKGHHHRPAMVSTLKLEDRVQRALAADRSQTALELARRLYHDEKTPGSLGLLKKASLARADDLCKAGHTRDASSVLASVLPLAGEDADWLLKIAQGFARSGEPGRALALLPKIADAAAQRTLLNACVDAVMERGPSGQQLLPEDLRSEFTTVLRAMELSAAGQDGAAREMLQVIGLNSPFLEWKLLLRGLIAYYQNEDARALENWGRLDPQRLPARLAAPLRIRLDRAYYDAQPAAQQLLLQRQADRLQGSGLTPLLRSIQACLGKEGSMGQALRQAEQMLAAVKHEAPALLPRLASSFYWAIVQSGAAQDVPHYRRVFGPPADDGELDRMHALMSEREGDLARAHKHWEKYQAWVAAHPEDWPAGQAEPVRALVWEHMGENAAMVPDPDQIPDLPAFLRDHPARPRPLKPSATDCYQQSLKLAADRVEPYEKLFNLYLAERENQAQAISMGRALLEHFPNHLPTLVKLGQVLVHTSSYAEAITLFERALKIDPLDGQLREWLAATHALQARAFLERGEFDQARAEYQQALACGPGKDHSSVLAKWAACEFKAGNSARADELLGQALAQAGSALPVAYIALIETIRANLPRPIKTRFDRAFAAGLAEPPTPAAAVRAVTIAGRNRAVGLEYRAQKTHEKKILKYLDQCKTLDFTEDQLVTICEALRDLQAYKPLQTFAALGEKKYPASPSFPLLEAESYIRKSPLQAPVWKLLPMLEKASRLAGALPADRKREELLERIHRYQQMAGVLGGGALSFMESLMGHFDPEGPWDDPDDDDNDTDDDFSFGDFTFVDPTRPPREKKKRRR